MMWTELNIHQEMLKIEFTIMKNTCSTNISVYNSTKNIVVLKNYDATRDSKEIVRV